MPAVKPNELIWLEWSLTGPAFASIEDTQFGPGYLGTAYTTNVDHRWADGPRLGPAINVVDCSGAGGTAATTNALVDSGSMNAGAVFLYVFRGTKYAKITISTMAIAAEAVAAQAAAVTDAIRTKAANGTQEIAIGMDNNAYQVITAVANAGSNDTQSSAPTQVMRIFGDGGSKNAVGRVAGLGRSGAAGTAQNTIYENILSGSVTMASPNWQPVGTITDDVTFTGFARDDDFWLIATDRGAHYADASFTEFRKLIAQIAKNIANRVFQLDFFGLNAIIANARGSRSSTSLSGVGFGPGRFEVNTSPVNGRCTAVAAMNEEWVAWVEYNEVTGDSYLLAMRPRKAGEWHNQPMSFYCLHTFTATAVNVLKELDTLGGRANPTLVGGHATDMFWLTQGRIPREIDDSNYRYNLTGTWFGTECRRFEHYDVWPRYIELTSDDCSATETLTVSLSVDGGASYDQIGGTIESNGTHRWEIKPEDPIRGPRLLPKIDFASGSSSLSPTPGARLRVGLYLKPRADEDGNYVDGERNA